ncbi:MAG: hypothetical protein ACI4QX_04815, partial [Lachnospiraceae bacterium]
MGKKLLCFILFVAGALCACNKEGVERQTGNQMPTATGIPTVGNQTPTATGIPITEYYFGNSRFCEMLKQKYDTDGDSFLSESERDAVITLSWETETQRNQGVKIGEDDIELKGFELFKNLEDVDIGYASKVSITNHPAIKSYGSGEGYIDQTVIENCPRLEYIGYALSGGNISVKNCTNLQKFWAYECYRELGTLEFIGTPKLNATFYLSSPEQITMDADAAISFEGFGMSEGTPINNVMSEIKEADSILQYFNEVAVKWLEADEQSILLKENFPLAYITEDAFSYITFQVLKKIEDIYDDAGNKGYNICLDFHESIHSKAAVSFYSPIVPQQENFIVRPGQIQEIEIIEYSPNGNTFFKVKWNL